MASTLLAIDDSVTMRKVLEMTFAGTEFTVSTVDSAAAALASLAELSPALIVADLSLEGPGGEGGYDLCRSLKEKAPGTPVLLLSSKHHPYDAEKGNAVGADGQLDKPFDSQALIDRARALVASRAEQPAAAPEPAAAPAVTTSTSAATAPEAPAPQPQAAAATSAPSAPIAAAVSGQLAGRLEGLGLTQAQVEGVLALSREVVEKVVWEVVPVLAEALIKEEIARLTR